VVHIKKDCRRDAPARVLAVHFGESIPVGSQHRGIVVSL